MPPCAASKAPTRRALAPVKAPFSCPNSSLSRRSGGSAAAIDDHERLLAPARQPVHRLRGRLLARPGLAFDEQRRLRRRRVLEQREHVAHLRRAPDEQAELASRATAGWPPRRRRCRSCSVVCPTVSRAPSCRNDSSTATPSTSVPFLLSRSRRRARPSRTVISQWKRETVRSSTTTSQLSCVPTTARSLDDTNTRSAPSTTRRNCVTYARACSNGSVPDSLTPRNRSTR